MTTDGNGFVPGTTVRDSSHCPTCGQFVKIYRWKLNTSTAQVMIAMWRLNEGREYVYIPRLFNTSALRGGTGNATKGKYWGLMECMPGVRADGSSRVGWWRLSDDGRDFVTSTLTVEKYAYLYNQTCLGLDGPAWTIRDALGAKFNYDELMNGDDSA